MDAWFQAAVGPVAHGGTGVDELGDVLMKETHFLGCVLCRLSRLLDAIVMSIPLQSACWGHSFAMLVFFLQMIIFGTTAT